MNKLFFSLVVLLFILGASVSASAGIDAPGSIHFHWLAEEETVYDDYPELPPDAERFLGRAYFSSYASGFGSNGVFIWGGFELQGPMGRGYGMLLLDLDLTRAPLDGETPMPHSTIRAEYIEKWGDQVLFEGEAVVGDVWILDVIFHHDDEGAVEGDFAMVFADPTGAAPGCRVFLGGQFVTNPSPGKLRDKYGVPDDVEMGYVSHGCSGDVYVVDGDPEGCDCGGEDPDAGGCEGDTTGGSDCGGCEGDAGGCDGGSGGCEGDVGGGCSGGGGGGCSGAGGAGACGAATAGLRARGAPLRGVMKFLPEIVVLLFIGGMRRRLR